MLSVVSIPFHAAARNNEAALIAQKVARAVAHVSHVDVQISGGNLPLPEVSSKVQSDAVVAPDVDVR
jgi:hypothetical protein